jgi:hypothetical protein
MLKIKDNVDLKELEKFGFEFDDKIGRWLCLDKKSLIKTYVKINSWNGKIQICIPLDCDQLVPDVLYDLIQAGLVEKV